MNQQANDPTLGKFYVLVIILVFALMILCLVLAVGLAVYADQADKPSETVESLVPVLSHCVTLFAGGFAGILTGPGFARFTQHRS